MNPSESSRHSKGPSELAREESESTSHCASPETDSDGIQSPELPATKTSHSALFIQQLETSSAARSKLPGFHGKGSFGTPLAAPQHRQA
eukprot:scaffold88_cov223-Pinguiococcus_pyrenoidosus.AAC.4